jgi:hypothetical protein
MCYNFNVPVSPQLAKYVSDERRKGISDDVIKQNLSASGWATEDIADTLAIPNPSIQGDDQVPLPRKFKKSLLVRVILLLVLVLVGVAVYLTSPSGWKKLSSISSNNLNSVTLPGDSVSTFADANGVFTVDYPSDWKIYPVKAQDTSLGGVNIYPDESVAIYEKRNQLSFDWTAYVFPFDQHNGETPIISVGGTATFDEYKDRSQYDFKATNIYKTLQLYFKSAQQRGNFANVVLKDVEVNGEPALVATFEDAKANSKAFYMIKLASRSITQELPMTAYFVVQYIAPKDKYSDEIAGTLLNSFKDDVATAVNKSRAEMNFQSY